MYDRTPSQLDQSVVLEDVYFYALDDVCHGLVLTPACDFAQHKADLALVCALLPVNELVSGLLQTDWMKLGLTQASGALVKGSAVSNTKKKEFDNLLKRLIGQQFPRYHWLAPLPGTSHPLVADFQTLGSLPAEELVEHPRLAALVSPYREQVPARYAAYVGRVGTPEWPAEDVTGWLTVTSDSLFGPT